MGVPFRTLGKRTWVFILVIGGGAALYWLFVQTRLHQIHEFNNRELGHAAKLVMDAVGSVTDNANHWHEAKDVCRFQKEQPYLVREEERECQLTGRFESAVLESANRSLQIHFKRTAAEAPSTPDHAEPAFEVNFRSILGELPFAESFDTYFVADENGKIAYQEANVHVHPVRKLGCLDALIVGANAAPGASRRIGDLSKLVDTSDHRISLDQFKGGTIRSA